MSKNTKPEYNPIKERIHEIIFEADTKEGKWFDVLLLIAILASVIVVMLESVPEYASQYGTFFSVIEWIFTIFFTIEYGLRIYAVHSPRKYITSSFGIIDLLSILPAYVGFFLVGGTQSLMVIRGLRLLRVFRIFKLVTFLKEAQFIVAALKASRAKIFVFVSFIVVLVCIFGSLMYLIEGNANDQFDSIPRSIYWAIVTLTTVGYGDMTPVTSIGQFIAAMIMISGYAVIAVPTGIVTAEAMKATEKSDDQFTTQACRYCSQDGHDQDAVHCKYCGEILNEEHD